MGISATALGLLIDLTRELKAQEWEGTDASATPLCSWCHRDPPDIDVRNAPGYDYHEHHNTDCPWVALMDRADSYLGRKAAV